MWVHLNFNKNNKEGIAEEFTDTLTKEYIKQNATD